MPKIHRVRMNPSIRKNGIRLNNNQQRESNDSVVVASGSRSRNRDRYSGKPIRLVPAGMRLQGWRANPLILWHHNFEIPLAVADFVLREGKLWAENFNFHRRIIPIATQNFIGDAIGVFDTSVMADLWRDRYLNAMSIHVMFEPSDEDNIIETDDEIVFMTSEVLEGSIVTIPGDRDSVRPGSSESIRRRLVGLGLTERVASLLVSNQPLRAWKQSTIKVR